MSAVSLKLVVFLCLHWMIPTNTGASEVEWREPGGNIAIECKTPQLKQDSLALKKGINQETTIIFATKEETKPIVSKEVSDRLQMLGKFPDFRIVIDGLTFNDTAPYWCEYSSFDTRTHTAVTTRGDGSVLLVVRETEEKTAAANAGHGCGPSQQDLVLVSVAISAVVLILIILVFLTWIFLKKKSQRQVKPRCVNNNNAVYEDMRGTRRH